nr:uncharacterized protein LOC105464252 [Macaca nemestrina]
MERIKEDRPITIKDDKGNLNRCIADVVSLFITVMDKLRLEIRAMDEIQPDLRELMETMHRMSHLPPDFEGRQTVSQWCRPERHVGIRRAGRLTGASNAVRPGVSLQRLQPLPACLSPWRQPLHGRAESEAMTPGPLSATQPWSSTQLTVCSCPSCVCLWCQDFGGRAPPHNKDTPATLLPGGSPRPACVSPPLRTLRHIPVAGPALCVWWPPCSVPATASLMGLRHSVTAASLWLCLGMQCEQSCFTAPRPGKQVHHLARRGSPLATGEAEAACHPSPLLTEAQGNQVF